MGLGRWVGWEIVTKGLALHQAWDAAGRGGGAVRRLGSAD